MIFGNLPAAGGNDRRRMTKRQKKTMRLGFIIDFRIHCRRTPPSAFYYTTTRSAMYSFGADALETSPQSCCRGCVYWDSNMYHGNRTRLETVCEKKEKQASLDLVKLKKKNWRKGLNRDRERPNEILYSPPGPVFGVTKIQHRRGHPPTGDRGWAQMMSARSVPAARRCFDVNNEHYWWWTYFISHEAISVLIFLGPFLRSCQIWERRVERIPPSLLSAAGVLARIHRSSTVSWKH